MTIFENYTHVLWGILVIIATVLIQATIAAASKAAQPGAIPGKLDDRLSHDSFVFRAHRTFMNSIESVPWMLGTIFLAILGTANLYWTALLVWVYAIARIAHMLLYYLIATERNPSPRSWFFLLGFLANVMLLGVCAAGLIQ